MSCEFFLSLPAMSRPRPGLGRHVLGFTDHTKLDKHTHTPGRNLWSNDQLAAKALYPHNTQQTQKTNINDLSGTETCQPSNQADTDLCLRTRGVGTSIEWKQNVHPGHVDTSIGQKQKFIQVKVYNTFTATFQLIHASNSTSLYWHNLKLGTIMFENHNNPETASERQQLMWPKYKLFLLYEVHKLKCHVPMEKL